MTLRMAAIREVLALDAPRSTSVLVSVARLKVGAQSAALFAVDGDEWVLCAAAATLGQREIQAITMAWESSRDVLRAGRPLARDGWTLAPIGRPVAGMLYFGGGTPGHVQTVIRELGDAFLAALDVRNVRPESEAALEEMTPEELEAHQLRMLLERFEGNVARVARELHVTRVTVYRKIERHGLDLTRYGRRRR